ncbi:MAG TPA: tripartite tricarboxylate transporter substrate binding protein [Burkholderiales bacterium]|jgi:tripartite-type tricarboxylate transporter receptor subunit TctC|nr:tripartite tricarboxylate transporter substrate binding protein [Burkholderiales bacterium]
MHLSLRLRCASIAALLLVSASQAAAVYPERPIRLIISSAAGGSPDVVSRILAAELVKQMGQQIIIDNRPGGAQTIGTELVVRANPDGYTLGYANVVTLAINKSLLPKQPYDPDKDLVLVGQFLSTYNVLAVTNSLPVKSVKELIAYAKQNPGKLLNASSGNGTTGHLGGELFKIMTGTQIVHVPYKGSPQGITDLIAGQVQVMFDNLTSISPHVRSGKVRGLGVSSLKRSPIFPDIPSISEAGVPGYETNSWGGMVAPVGTSKAIVTRLNTEINKALQSPMLKERYASIEAEPVGGTPEQFAAFVKKETVKWGDVVKKSGAKID